jgi:molecular chaperone HtpG
MFERKERGLRLFVKRVFVMEDCEEVLPEWLRFLRGIVDSEDLPLNVSREILQQDQTTRFIRKQVIGRALTLLEELAEEGETVKTEGEGDDAKEVTVHRYHRFWNEFGHILKEGIHHEPEHKDRIARLLRYHTTHGDELTSLADYVGRMKDDQPGIYFLTAANLATAKNSPHIESLTQRGYEVLLMVDPVDEWIVERLTEFDDVKLISAAKGALDVPESEEEKKAKEEKQGELKDLLSRMQSTLGEHVKEVRVTSRLTDSPACLVSDPHGISPHHERMLRAYGHEVPPQKRILEINPDHPVVVEMERLAADDSHAAEFEDWAQLVFDQALVAEGCLPDDPAQLAKSIAKLMRKASSA